MEKRSISLLILLSIIIISSGHAIAASNTSNIDLAFSSFECAPSGAPGNPIYAWFSLENKGDQISMTEKVTVYLSPDTNISGVDYPIGETEVSFLRPGIPVEKGLICTIPDTVPAGKYYAGAIVSGAFGHIRDANEDDNSITGNNVTVTSSYKRPQDWYNSRISDLVLKYTNAERIKRNLSELSRDNELTVIAFENSGDMAKRQYFDHINPSGENPIDRADRHGYNQLRYLPNGEKFYGIGENIVKIPIGNVHQYGDIRADDPDQVAYVVVEAFMNSPTHKATLILPEFEVIGIGTAFDGKNYYITQNFF